MPELNLGPPPSRSPLTAILAAALILTAVFFGIFLLNPRKTADFSVTSVKTYTARTTTAGAKGGMSVIGSLPHIEQDLYVLVNVKLTDKLRLPLFIKDETAILTAPDGSILETSAIQKAELQQIYTAFPEVAALASTPLTRDTQISPGQTSEGMVLLHFQGATQENWTARKSAVLSIALFHQQPLTVSIP